MGCALGLITTVRRALRRRTTKSSATRVIEERGREHSAPLLTDDPNSVAPNHQLSSIPSTITAGEAMLLIILVVFLVLALGGGGWGHSRYGAAGWSPAGLILLALVVLWLTGNLHT